MVDTAAQEFKQVFNDLLSELKLTPTEFSRLLDYATPNTAMNWKQGKTLPSFSALVELSDKYGVNIADGHVVRGS